MHFHKPCGDKIVKKMLYSQSDSMRVSEGQLLYYIKIGKVIL